jgi:hypothetical protein
MTLVCPVVIPRVEIDRRRVSMTRTTADTEIIAKAIHLACREPSLHNSQPWRWVVGEAPVDWLRNMLAADRATIQISGQTYQVVHPKINDR